MVDACEWTWRVCATEVLDEQFGTVSTTRRMRVRVVEVGRSVLGAGRLHEYVQPADLGLCVSPLELMLSHRVLHTF